MLNPSTSKSQYRSLYTGPSNASYSLSKASRECTSILKRFHALFLPLCTLIQCLVIAMPPQSLKIDHLPSDASAILRERYLASTFSVVTQCWLCFGHTRLTKTRKDVALPRPDKARRVSPGFENWFMYPGVCRVMFLCMEWYDIYVGLYIADNKINHGYISLAANLVKTLKKMAMFLHIATRVSSLH